MPVVESVGPPVGKRTSKKVETDQLIGSDLDSGSRHASRACEGKHNKTRISLSTKYSWRERQYVSKTTLAFIMLSGIHYLY